MLTFYTFNAIDFAGKVKTFFQYQSSLLKGVRKWYLFVCYMKYSK